MSTGGFSTKLPEGWKLTSEASIPPPPYIPDTVVIWRGSDGNIYSRNSSGTVKNISTGTCFEPTPDETPFERVCNALRDMPAAEQQKVYEFLYSLGCRINR